MKTTRKSDSQIHANTQSSSSGMPVYELCREHKAQKSDHYRGLEVI